MGDFVNPTAMPAHLLADLSRIVLESRAALIFVGGRMKIPRATGSTPSTSSGQEAHRKKLPRPTNLLGAVV